MSSHASDRCTVVVLSVMHDLFVQRHLGIWQGVARLFLSGNFHYGKGLVMVALLTRSRWVTVPRMFILAPPPRLVTTAKGMGGNTRPTPANHPALGPQKRLLSSSCTHAYYQLVKQEHSTLSQVDTAIAATFGSCIGSRALCFLPLSTSALLIRIATIVFQNT